MEIIAAAELLLAIVVLITAIFLRRPGLHRDAASFQWAIGFFCISSMLVIGYVVPFTGAIVRYRAVFLMLLLVIASFSTGKKPVEAAVS